MALILIPQLPLVYFTVTTIDGASVGVSEARYNIIDLSPFVTIPWSNIFGAVISGTSSVCIQILTADV